MISKSLFTLAGFKSYGQKTFNLYLLEKGISEVRLILFLFLSRATLFPKFPVFPFTLILSWRNFSCERRKANPTGLGKVTLTLTREENPSPTCISTSQNKSKPIQELGFPFYKFNKELKTNS